MGMCRGRSHSNIIAVRLFFPSWFTPGYIHAITLFSKANHFCILHPIAHKYMGTFPVTRVGFELHSPLLNKASLSGLRGLLCLCGSWLGVWWLNWVKCNFSQSRIHTHSGHSAADLSCSTLLSNITLWVCFSRSECLPLQRAGYVLYWIPQHLNSANLSHLVLLWVLWASGGDWI